MKQIVFLLSFIFSSQSFAQLAKYDGDWSAVFQGVGVLKGIDGRPDPDSPVIHGYGKRIYRIKTIDGVTTVRAKVKYVGENDYSYYQCVVTSCNESSLNWYTQTAHYNFEEWNTIYYSVAN